MFPLVSYLPLANLERRTKFTTTETTSPPTSSKRKDSWTVTGLYSPWREERETQAFMSRGDGFQYITQDLSHSSKVWLFPALPPLMICEKTEPLNRAAVWFSLLSVHVHLVVLKRVLCASTQYGQRHSSLNNSRERQNSSPGSWSSAGRHYSWEYRWFTFQTGRLSHLPVLNYWPMLE